MPKQISRHTSKRNLKTFIDSLFTSTLCFCMPIYMNTWGINTYVEAELKKYSFTKEDCKRLQIIQNQVLRLQLALPRGYFDDKGIFKMFSTQYLLGETDSLSVHQYGAFTTIMLGARILSSKTPHYLYSRLCLTTSRRGKEMLQIKNFRLNMTEEGFIQRFRRLWNMIPEELKINCQNISFKESTKRWVQKTIKAIP